MAVAERRGLECDSTNTLKFQSCKNRQFIPLKMQSRKYDKWTKKIDRESASCLYTKTVIINMKERSSKLSSDLAEVAWIKTFLCENKHKKQ